MRPTDRKSPAGFWNLIAAVSFARARSAVSLFTLTPFDTSSERGRAQERYRRAALTAGASLMATAVSVLVSLASVPLTVHYLGTERYGLWMTISSVVTMVAFADLGLSNGVMNAVSEANGRDDRQLACQYVTSAFFVLSGIAVVVLVLFAMAYGSIPWIRVFNVQSELAAQEAGPAIAVFITCFAIGLPLGIAQRVQMGYQEGFTSRLWQISGSLLSLAGLLVVVRVQAGLPWLVLAIAGAPTLAMALNWLVEFAVTKPWLFPRVSQFRWDSSRRVISTGLMFFAVQLFSTLTSASDNLVIAQVLGPAAVADYAVPSKLFTLATVLPMLIITPLWTAYGEALTRGDFLWIRNALRRSSYLGLGISLGTGIVLVALGREIIDIWVGTAIAPSVYLLLAIGTATIVTTATHPQGVFLFGVNALTFSLVSTGLMMPVAIASKVLLAEMIGLPGVPWASAITYVVFVTIPVLIYIPRFLSRAEEHGLGRRPA